MIHHDYTQGGIEWKLARLGIPTSSKTSKILTPARLELSKQSDGLILRLIAERHLGWPLDEADGGWMDRGTDLEPEAREWYAFATGREVTVCGFCSDDNHTEGGSPDGLVGDDGIIEIKCRNAPNHLAILFGDSIADRLQVQNNLRITGRAWCDEIAYCPGMPQKIVRSERNEDVIGAIDLAMAEFKQRLESEWTRFCEMFDRDPDWRTALGLTEAA